MRNVYLVLIVLSLTACGKSPSTDNDPDLVGPRVKSIFSCNTTTLIPSTGEKIIFNYYIETYENGEVVVGCYGSDLNLQQDAYCGPNLPLYSFSFQTPTSSSDPTLITVTDSVSETSLGCNTVTY